MYTTTKLLLCATTLVACGRTEPTGSRFEVAARALSLSGVGDIAYTIDVHNHAGERVWRKEALRATRYGNGTDLTYIGTCDASAGANPHTVTLVIEDLFTSGGARIDPASWQNPTPVVVEAECHENEDTLVAIDLTIMRDADQGFFDVAVNFDEIFCSAKFDCKEAPLLFDPDTGERVPTAVLGFACTGGAVGTHLWLDDVVLTCGGVARVLDIAGPDGNQYSAANPPPAPLVQVATYYGVERLTDNGVSLGKLYFDMAFGLDFGAVTEDCTLDVVGSASKAAFTTLFTTPAATVWPLVRWHIDLVDGATKDYACGVHPLNDPNGVAAVGVHTEYAHTPHVFDYVLTRDPADATRAVLVARGEVVPEGARLEVRFFGDPDRDGVFDEIELPIVGASVAINGPGGGVALVTGVDGRASAPVAAGDWTIATTTNDLALEGYLASSPTLPTTVTVASTGVTRVVVGFVEAAEIRGVVFVGEEGDLLFDGDEERLAGVVVQLVGDDAHAVTTLADGRFRFVVLPGDWSLEVPVGQSVLGPYAPAMPLSLTLQPGEFVPVDLGLEPL